MDDPWGSPWTSTDRSGELPPSPTHLPSPFESGLSAHVPDRLFPLPDQSAWTDQEERFGDWAVADEPTAAPVSFDFDALPNSIADINISEPTDRWNDSNALPADEPSKIATPSPNETYESPQAEASLSKAVSELHDERASTADTTKTRESDGAESEESLPSDHESAGASGEDEHGKQDAAILGETAGSGDRLQGVLENGTRVKNVLFPLPEKPEALPRVPKPAQSHDGLAQASEESSPKALFFNGSEQINKCAESITPRNEPPAAIIGNAAERPVVLAGDDMASERCFQSSLSSLEEYSLTNAIDEKQVASLFSPATVSTPGSQDSPLSPTDGCISEAIISDSFTTISERKSWYRISRQGSSRKHDAGDDNNYRPISWLGSTIRSKTVKIVRRWMEEDSFTGKPILGTNGARGNLFGWDSAAKPVTLDEVYKRNSSNQSVSLPSPTEHQHSPPGTEKNNVLPSSNEFSGIRLRWSSTISPKEEQESVQKSAAVSAVSAVSVSPHGSTRQANALTIVTTGPFSTATDSGDDDDEWGEMVSSPAQKTTFPIPPETVSMASLLQESRSQEGVQVARTSTEEEAGDLHSAVSDSGSSQHTSNQDDDSVFREAPAPSSSLREETPEVEEEFVHDIICGLPNLSYMAR